MMSEIIILIPVKEHSQRCYKKNYTLLPYTANYLHEEALADRACVITDSVGLVELASSLELKTYLELRDPKQDELTSCYNYAVNNNIEEFFLCPATQPFKGDNLFQQMIELFGKENNKLDFITTVSEVQDRKLFFVNKTKTGYQFSHKMKNRKGSDCKTKYMIDGVLYLIKTSFLKAVMKAEDINEAFWKGKFNCIKNEAPFMDIDTMEDLRKFGYLKKYFFNSVETLFV